MVSIWGNYVIKELIEFNALGIMYIKKMIEFPLGVIKLRIVTLNLLIDSIFLTLPLSLLHFLIQYDAIS